MKRHRFLAALLLLLVGAGLAVFLVGDRRRPSPVAAEGRLDLAQLCLESGYLWWLTGLEYLYAL